MIFRWEQSLPPKTLNDGANPLLKRSFEMLNIRIIKDEETGFEFRSIGKEHSHTASGYISENFWTSDGKSMLLYTDQDQKTAVGNMILYNIETGDEKLLAKKVSWECGIISSDDKLYLRGGSFGYPEFSDTHVWEIYKQDLKTGDRRLLYSDPKVGSIDRPLTITADGKLLGIVKDIPFRTLFNLDTETGETTDLLTREFDPPNNTPNHVQINPVYHNLTLYSHEGLFVKDRIWVYDSESKTSINVFKQCVDENGEALEHVGHEIWSKDGEQIYFVKYFSGALRTDERPDGVCRIDKDGKNLRFINHDYRYTHCYPSRDGKWIVADTFPDAETKKVGIVLINGESGKSMLVCNQPHGELYVHPGHAHPVFTPDENSVVFTYGDEEGFLRTAIVDVSEAKRRLA